MNNSTNTYDNINNQTEVGNNNLQSILNTILGVLIFTLNSITFISLVVCKSVGRKEKVCYLAIITSDTLTGLQTLLVRLSPLQYNGDHILCYIRMLHAFILAFMTIFSNLMVTVERFLCMVMPLTHSTKITCKKLALIFVMIWIGSIILSLSLFYDGFSGNKSCQFLNARNKAGYLVLGICMCTVVLIDYSMYAYIYKVLRNHIQQIASTMVPGHVAQANENATNTRNVFIKKKKLQATKTLGIITFLFGIAYFPMGILLIYYSTSYSLINPLIFQILFPFYMLNSLMNPLIYIWRLDSCRKEILNKILCRPISIETSSSTNTRQ